MGKILWLDTETTGVDPSANAIIQIAGIIEIDGVDREEINLFMRPHEGAVITDEALCVTGRTREEISAFSNPKAELAVLKSVLSEYVNRFDRKDKFIVAGFNVGFDVQFMRALFSRNGDKYYGSWFAACPMDVWSFVAMYICKNGLCFENLKLTTVAEYFGIHIENAHNALDDVRACREVYRTILDRTL